MNLYLAWSPGPEHLLLRAGGSDPHAEMPGRSAPGAELRMTILADDLTGACDAAAPFAGQASVPVLIGRPETAPTSAVWAVDLDVRDSAAGVVRTETALAAGIVGPSSRLFLKIDSAGRSPTSGMIEGVSTAWPGRIFLISPAFPEQGARMIDGKVVLGDQAAAARDLLDQMDARGRTPSRIAERPGEGRQAFRERVRTATSAGAERIVVDATGRASLSHVASLWRDDTTSVAVGSSGLARAIARGIAGGGHHRRRPPPGRTGPIAIVSGSPTTVAWTQLAAVAAAFPTIARVAPGTARGSPSSASREDLVIYAGPRVLAAGDDGGIAQSVADRAADGVVGALPRGIVLVGGATARALLAKVGCERLDVAGELGPGIPHGVVRGGALEGIPFVAKSGRFGRPQTLVDAVRFLDRHRPA